MGQYIYSRNTKTESFVELGKLNSQFRNVLFTSQGVTQDVYTPLMEDCGVTLTPSSVRAFGRELCAYGDALKESGDCDEWLFGQSAKEFGQMLQFMGELADVEVYIC